MKNLTRAASVVLISAAASFVWAVGGCNSSNDASCGNLQTDNANCGVCGNKCGTGTSCVGGVCGTGSGACGANTDTDNANCGACGVVCAKGQVCSVGACGVSCADGYAACGETCAKVDSDRANCGACGTVCSNGESCKAGACYCGVASLSAGRLQTCGLREDGKVLCAGAFSNSCDNGQGPDGGSSPCNGVSLGNTAPSLVPSLANAAEYRSGDSFGCARKMDGTVWCVGSNQNGALGNNGTVPSAVPVQVIEALNDGGAPTYLSTVAHVAAGAYGACAVKTNGELWCWGTRESNQPIATREQPAGAAAVTSVAIGNGTTCVLSAGTVRCWTGSPATTTEKLTGATAIAAGDGHTCAIKTDKTLWCWGANNASQCGIPSGTSTDIVTATQVTTDGTTGVADVEEVALGSAHTCFRKGDKSVWCLGMNHRGQLGIGTQTDPTSNPRSTVPGSPFPVRVLAAGGAPLVATAITAGHNHSCAIVGASLHPTCWGQNMKGQIGVAEGISFLATPMTACGN